jgi:hypothetical protein
MAAIVCRLEDAGHEFVTVNELLAGSAHAVP